MKLSEVKNNLQGITDLQFRLPTGEFVPEHFHVTEVGLIHKNFIDCGGTVRGEKVANFQLWDAEDHDHRLAPKKLNDIIILSQKVLAMDDLLVEVEYQGNTIGKYELDFDGKHFVLINTQTNCLAREKCGVDENKQKVHLSDLAKENDASYSPAAACC